MIQVSSHLAIAWTCFGALSCPGPHSELAAFHVTQLNRMEQLFLGDNIKKPTKHSAGSVEVGGVR